MSWPTLKAELVAWVEPEAAVYRNGTWSSRGFRSARARARRVKILFALAASAAVGAAFACNHWAGFLAEKRAGAAAAPDEALSWEPAWLIAWAGFLALTVVFSALLVIAIPAWFSRTVDNVPPLTGGTPRRGPRASILWWFVPVLNLIVPLSMVREAWHRYATPSRSGRNRLLTAWWLAGLAGWCLLLLPTVAMLVSRRSIFPSGVISTMDQDLFVLQTYFAVLTVGFGLVAVAAVLGLYAVDQLGDRANERAMALGLERGWADQPAPQVPYEAPFLRSDPGVLPAWPPGPSASAASAQAAGQQRWYGPNSY